MSKNVHYIMTFDVEQQEGESPGAATMHVAAEIAVKRQEHKVMSQEGESPGAAAMRAAAKMVKEEGYEVREWKRAGVCQTDDGWLLSRFVASTSIPPPDNSLPRFVHVEVKY